LRRRKNRDYPGELRAERAQKSVEIPGRASGYHPAELWGFHFQAWRQQLQAALPPEQNDD
jgi:hypothetical protein